MIPLMDLAAPQAQICDRIQAGIARFFAPAAQTMGAGSNVFEGDLAAFCGAHRAIGIAELVPAFKVAATIEALGWFGPTPVFADVDYGTFSMDPASLAHGIAAATCAGLRPVAAISVDLFGQTADYDRVAPILARHGLWLVSNAAHSFGSTRRGRKVDTNSRVACTSFLPSKKPGCYHDSDVVPNDDWALVAA
jgi:dTDP-4-amino-4,6-dideoxygalactose transaminase